VTISTQTIGVVMMAVMAVSGLAVTSSVLSHRSVSDRLLFYQAEEIAMDIEIMKDWGEGSQVIKSFRNDYSRLKKDVRNGKTWIVLSSDENSVNTTVNIDSGALSIDGGDIEDFSCINFAKGSGNQIEISRAGEGGVC
jgi:hypothetical protein